jgi:DamX protein
MSALINSIGLSDDNTSVTKISVNARIDYILRFSKHAILVIDESVQQNSQITNQFIATIPEQHNAAYISLSTQFNDIQLRCRVIEQLSAGELFDPEVSLAVSIVNLAKKAQQAITIVLDNAEHLSLQILHEVTQLTVIAKKSNLMINVVMFGSPQVGIKVQENKNLFHNKLSLLSAQSGQLLTASASIFQKPQAKWYVIKLNKWLLSAFILLFCLAAAVITLLQQDSFNFTAGLVKAENNKEVTLDAALNEPQPTVLNGTEDTAKSVAKPSDIYTSLLAPKIQAIVVEMKQEPIAAAPSDIMLAMTALPSQYANLAKQNEVLIDVANNEEIKTTSVTMGSPNANLENLINADNSYYLAKNSGFVIQIAVFSDADLSAEFLRSLSDIDYHVYQRLFENTPTFVITSQVFTDKLSARQGLVALPASIIARQPWIKSLTVINSEINAFQGSQ